MKAAGWTPRAGGWFTRSLTSRCLAVVATGVATKHAGRSEGQATAHLGLRLEPVEQVAAALCEVKDEGYKQRTAVLGLGYATPARRWLEWPVADATVIAVAAELTATVSEYGLPYLERLAGDDGALEAELRAVNSAVGLARRVVFLALAGRVSQASEALQQGLEGLDGRTDRAAVHMHEAGQRLSVWLAGRGG